MSKNAEREKYILKKWGNQMAKEKEFLMDFLSRTDSLYLKSNKTKDLSIFKEDEGLVDFLSVYRVDEITFEDKAPRKEALENVISSINIEKVNFVYIILGNKEGINFYYGIARDFMADGKASLEITEIGNQILKPSLQGNFRGSRLTSLNTNQKKKLLADLDGMKEVKILEGVPGINKDDESFQSVDRIIDVMLGDRFAMMLVAKPMSLERINLLQDKMYELYNVINPLAKSSLQESSGKSHGTSESKTEGDSVTEGTNHSYTVQSSKGTSSSHTDGKSFGSNKGTSQSTQREKSASGKTIETQSGSEGSSKGESFSDTNGSTETHGISDAKGDSKSTSKSCSESKSTQNGDNVGTSTTLEIVNKKVQDWIKYLDEVILPRIDYGAGKGLFISAATLFGDTPASLIKLENTIRSVYSGESGNKIPLRAFQVNESEKSYLRRMQIPKVIFNNQFDSNEINVRTVCSQYFEDENTALLGSWMSSKELSLFAGLPQKEVVGLALREEVEFGLNSRQEDNRPEDSVLLGHMVQNGVVLDGNGNPEIEVRLKKEYFDKHIFVTGVTGSGKTTTCQKLLLEKGGNFLVIEPAKTEYRALTETFPDMLVFTLGNETGAPFRLNPLEFLQGENITSRVDMIKASMEAAFDMEAAIPQLLETALYHCYEKKGWDISTNKNIIYQDPFADGIMAFPTLGDLDLIIEEIVKEQGFDDRLKDEYIGSIRARMKGLLIGAKGQMLNTPRSLDFVELLDKKVVLELENIKSASEKSLIMGFILTNLSEAIKYKYGKGHKSIGHITLVEEAHRLLSKYMPGDSMNKKQGVEMFSDMLAEVRKYGESLIIADQIPNKLTTEVLKNTNTKIVHKIFAQDDKEAIGNTMALKDEQKEYLSYLSSGHAVLMNPGLSKAVQIKVLQTRDNDTERMPPEDAELRKRILKYYASIYKKGILPGLKRLKEEPSVEIVDFSLKSLRQFITRYKECVHYGKNVTFFRKLLQDISREMDIHIISEIVFELCYEESVLERCPQIIDYINDYLLAALKENQAFAHDSCMHYKELDAELV